MRIETTSWWKNQILGLSFVLNAQNQCYKQGGIDSFPLAQKDVLETMRDDLDKKAEELAQEKLAKLLSVVDERKVIKFSDREKRIYVNGERLDDVRLASLRAEAEYFLASDLWQILYETPKELAQIAMFVAGESMNDMIKGRAILYTLSTQKKILDTLKGYAPQTPSTSSNITV